MFNVNCKHVYNDHIGSPFLVFFITQCAGLVQEKYNWRTLGKDACKASGVPLLLLKEIVKTKLN